MAASFWYGIRDGWLRCGLTVGRASVLHSVNGWHDGLLELIRAACALFGRASEATARFQEEPGEFRWRITRTAANRIRVRVYEFDDWGTGRPDEAGKLLFDAQCGVMTFAEAIQAGSGRWLAELESAGRAMKVDLLREERDQLRGILRQHDYSESHQTDSDPDPGSAPGAAGV